MLCGVQSVSASALLPVLLSPPVVTHDRRRGVVECGGVGRRRHAVPGRYHCTAGDLGVAVVIRIDGLAG